MSNALRVNEVLELMGSEYRAYPGTLIDDAYAELIACLPAYVDRIVEERLAKIAVGKEHSVETQSGEPK